MVICSAIYSTALAVARRTWWVVNVTAAMLVIRNSRIASAVIAIRVAQPAISATNIQPNVSAKKMCRVWHVMYVAKAPSTSRLRMLMVVLSASASARPPGTLYVCDHYRVTSTLFESTIIYRDSFYVCVCVLSTANFF